MPATHLKTGPYDPFTDAIPGERALIDYACIVSETDSRGVITFVNDSFCHISGYTRDELIGENHRLVNSGIHDKEFWHEMFATLIDKGFWQGTICNKAKDGSLYWVQTTNLMFRDDKGRVDRYVSIRTDITHAMRSRLELDRFFTVSQDLHCIIGSAGRFKRLSPAWEATLGYAEQDLIGQTFQHLVHPEDRDQPAVDGQQTQVGLNITRFENRLRRVDGTYRWFQWITVADPHDGTVFCTARDITEHKALNHRLDAQAAAIDASQAVVEFTLGGKVLTANHRFLSLMGYEIDEVVGQHHRMFVDAEQAASSRYIKFWQALSRGEFQQAEFMRLTKAGKAVWLQATYTPIPGPDGRPDRVIKFATDITERRRLNLRLDAQLKAIDASQSVIEFDIDGTILSANQRFLDLMGFELEEIEGRHHRIFVEADYADSPGYAEFWDQLRSGAFQSSEFKRVTRAGKPVWLQATYTPVMGLDGEVERVIKFAVDVTDRKRLDLRLDAQVKAINASQAVIEFSLEGEIITANDRFLNLMGYALDEVVGQHHRMFVDPMYATSEDYQGFWESLRRGEFRTAEFKRFSKSGEAVWMRSTYTPVLGPDGKPERIIKIANDITSDKTTEQVLQAAAETDKLTGLPNRLCLTQHIQEVLQAAAQSPDVYFALLFLDFDRFKLINDTLGHEMGDELLVQIAGRLREQIEADKQALPGLCAIPARLGGDEFVVLLEGLTGPKQAKACADRLLTVFNEPYLLNGQKVFSTASIGIADSLEQPATPEDLLRDADTAMYQAKTQGKNRYVCFNPLMRQRLESRVELERDLHHALEHDQFILMYQPIASVESGEVTGAEALIRWEHPTKGLIPPNDFIPIAEECGLILPIGEWVLREACAQFMRWQNASALHQLKTISINLSRNQLALPDLHETIGRIFEASGIAPAQVRLEITESTVMSDVEAAKAILDRLKALGAKVVMDDFGTGYSSLACLHEFSFDGLKIDRSFVNKIDSNRSIAALVHTIASLASNLGVDVVAEGVETMSQLSTLQALDCQYAQGYLIGRPVPAEKFMRPTPLSGPGTEAGAA